MNIYHAVIQETAKGSCNAQCARAVAALFRLIFRLCWGYLHYWTFAVVGGLGAIYTAIRIFWLGGDDPL